MTDEIPEQDALPADPAPADPAAPEPAPAPPHVPLIDRITAVEQELAGVKDLVQQFMAASGPYNKFVQDVVRELGL